MYRWFSRRKAAYEQESLTIEARRRANAGGFLFLQNDTVGNFAEPAG
jgi:hypothetical protein